jgi:BAAT / Acyl-CoA thioester hydrolase C terminal
VVILPVTRGDYPTKKVAAYLAGHGMASLLFLSRSSFTGNSEKDFPTLAVQIHDYVVEVRQSLDWLTRQPSIDSNRIGLLGMSLGAIVGTLVGGADPRIRSEVLLLGGGDLPGIIFSTHERSFVKMRYRLMEKQRLSPQALKQEAEKILASVEPLSHARRLSPANILMINAYFDQVVPRTYTLALWERIGRPHLVFVPTGHYTAILFLWYAESEAYGHFKKTLDFPIVAHLTPVRQMGDGGQSHRIGGQE